MDASESNEDQPQVVPPEDIIVRPVKELDILPIINLLKLNYGDDYPDQELYDPEWLKRVIYCDNVRWLLAENKRNKEVLASGAIKLDYGDYDDQLGIIGRLVAHPKRRAGGLLPLGSNVVRDLVLEAEKRVECVISDARTEIQTSQLMVQHAGLKVAGFLPNYKFFKKKPENLVVYTNLYGEGRMLRSEKLPQVIEEVEPLASHVLSDMDLPKALGIVKHCPPYSDEFACTFRKGDRHSLAQLRQLDRGRLSDPVVFANISSNYGVAVLADNQVYHKMAVYKKQLMGAFGYTFNAANQIFQITELVFNRAEVINPLCAEAVKSAGEQKIKLGGKMKKIPARIIEVDVSAYDARIQQTFLSYGFHPVAYIPAMVFHNASRLDVIKMIKLTNPYDSIEMKLTKKAERVASIVAGGLK